MILNTLHLQYSCLEAGKDWETTTLLSSLYHSLHYLSQFLTSSFHMPEDIVTLPCLFCLRYVFCDVLTDSKQYLNLVLT